MPARSRRRKHGAPLARPLGVCLGREAEALMCEPEDLHEARFLHGGLEAEGK